MFSKPGWVDDVQNLVSVVLNRSGEINYLIVFTHLFQEGLNMRSYKYIYVHCLILKWNLQLVIISMDRLEERMH